MQKYTKFIQEASNKGMDVYEVICKRRFIYSLAWQSAIYDTIDNVVNYNKTAPANGKIKGIEYDVEPHLNTEENKDDSISDWVIWDTNDKNCQAKNKYVNFVREAQRYAKSKNIGIGFDMTWCIAELHLWKTMSKKF